MPPAFSGLFFSYQFLNIVAGPGTGPPPGSRQKVYGIDNYREDFITKGVVDQQFNNFFLF